jgi:hypothetical protein
MALDIASVSETPASKGIVACAVGNGKEGGLRIRRPGASHKRRAVYSLIALILFLGIAAGYAHWFGNGVEPFVFRKPGVAALFNRKVVSLKPFIVPSISADKTYRVVSVDLTVDLERGDRVLRHLPELRQEIYNHLLHSGTSASSHYSRFDSTVGDVNSRIGSSIVKEIWIRKVRIM